MKRVLYIILAIVIPGLFAACQKTPESPIVIGKDHEQMIEQAVSGEETDMPAAQQVGAAERYSIDEPLTNAQGTLEVHIDAEVIAPYTPEITTARVGRHAFTQEECERYASALFDGQKTYSGSTFHTKGSAQREILELQKQLAEETDEGKRQQIQAHIEEIQMSLSFMPEGEGMVEAPVEFSMEPGGAEKIYLISDGSDGLYRSFQVRNNEEMHNYGMSYAAAGNDYPSIGNIWSMTTVNGLKHGTSEFGDPNALPDLQTSEDEAVAAAEQMLADMGITAFAYKTSDVMFGSINGTVQKAYQLCFTRVIGDASFNYSTRDKADFNSGMSVDDGKGGYIEVWLAESMTFLVTDDGVVSFKWINPYEVIEVVTEHTAMLDFDSIMEIFGKMIVVTNADVPVGLSKNISIERIELGLMRVLDPTSLDTGVVIPVWDFYGKTLFADIEGDSTEDDPNDPYLTINAVDGSIIDRHAGY